MAACAEATPAVGVMPAMQSTHLRRDLRYAGLRQTIENFGDTHRRAALRERLLADDLEHGLRVSRELASQELIGPDDPDPVRRVESGGKSFRLKVTRSVAPQ
jgi:hypothetical protein